MGDKKKSSCGGCLGLVVVLGIVVIAIMMSKDKSPSTTPPQLSRTKPKSTPRPKVSPKTPAEQIVLPDHKFSPSSRPGRAKSQLRAIVKPGVLTKSELMETAVGLCRKFESCAAGSFLVQFFSDASCLQTWDGTGLLRDSDWPHWLCRVAVETDARGQLYANTFELAVDETTGQKRTDVLKK